MALPIRRDIPGKAVRGRRPGPIGDRPGPSIGSETDPLSKGGIRSPHPDHRPDGPAILRHTPHTPHRRHTSRSGEYAHTPPYSAILPILPTGATRHEAGSMPILRHTPPYSPLAPHVTKWGVWTSPRCHRGRRAARHRSPRGPASGAAAAPPGAAAARAASDPGDPGSTRPGWRPGPVPPASIAPAAHSRGNFGPLLRGAALSDRPISSARSRARSLASSIDRFAKEPTR
jgi:hypothetical protein